MKDARKASAIAFLEAAAAYYASLGIKVERVMTDNGSGYLSGTSAEPAGRWALSTSVLPSF